MNKQKILVITQDKIRHQYFVSRIIEEFGNQVVGVAIYKPHSQNAKTQEAKNYYNQGREIFRFASSHEHPKDLIKLLTKA